MLPDSNPPTPPPPTNTPPITVVSSSRPPKSHKKTILGLISIVILLVGLGTGFFLLRQKNVFQPKASDPCPCAGPGGVTGNITSCNQACYTASCGEVGCTSVRCAGSNQNWTCDWNGGPNNCRSPNSNWGYGSCQVSTSPPPTAAPSCTPQFDSNTCQFCTCTSGGWTECRSNCTTGSCSNPIPSCGQKDYPSPNLCDSNDGCPGTQCGAAKSEKDQSGCVSPTSPPSSTTAPTPTTPPGVTPSATPPPASTPTRTPTPTPTLPPGVTPSPSPSPTPTPTPSPTPTPTPGPTATPTPGPTSTPGSNLASTPNSCNGTCGSDVNCQPGLSCYLGMCRNPNNPSDTSCANKPGPTPTPVTQLAASGNSVPTWLLTISSIGILGLGLILLL